MTYIRRFYDEKLLNVLMNDKLKDNMDASNNFIIERTQARNFMNSLRIFLSILGGAYFGGIMWYMFVNFYLNLSNEDRSEEENFHNEYTMTVMQPYEQLILCCYYAFSTFSSTGFGDVVPINDNERIISLFYMSVGCVVYSYVGLTFHRMVEKIQNFDMDFEDSGELERFFEIMKWFNGGRRLPIKFERQILQFFIYKWNSDRNYSIQKE